MRARAGWPRGPALAIAAGALLGSWPTVTRAGDAGGRWVSTVDASLALASERGSAALSWNHLYSVWPGRLEVGLGARATTLRVDGPFAFRTGDASLRGDGIVNQLVIEDPWVTSLNLQVLAIARIAGPVEVGFDIDLVGVSFGPRRTGSYAATDPRFSGAQGARVATPDLLLGGVRDRGQLNSELFAGVRLGPTWTVRGGLSHAVTSYRTVAELDHGNRDFQRFTTQAFVGVSARLR
jgi:hypothetical protein